MSNIKVDYNMNFAQYHAIARIKLKFHNIKSFIFQVKNKNTKCFIIIKCYCSKYSSNLQIYVSLIAQNYIFVIKKKDNMKF